MNHYIQPSYKLCVAKLSMHKNHYEVSQIVAQNVAAIYGSKRYSSKMFYNIGPRKIEDDKNSDTKIFVF